MLRILNNIKDFSNILFIREAVEIRFRNKKNRVLRLYY